jgi:SAM-dependent methyltransferase
MERTDSNPHEKWQSVTVAQRYARARFATRRARERDPRLVAALLARAVPSPETVLDAPCGAGRLFDVLESHGASVIGVDVSPGMLEQTPRGARVARGDVFALPFANASFDAVVCCRLAHHVHGGDDLARLVAELARVARRWVLLSFWDSASLPTWRERVGLKRGEGPRGRVARSRREIGAVLRGAGLEPRAWRASFRFVSQQTFVLAEKR